MTQFPASSPSPTYLPPSTSPPILETAVSALSPKMTPSLSSPSPATVNFPPMPYAAAKYPPSSISIPPSVASQPSGNSTVLNRVAGSEFIVFGLIAAALMI
ncbi:hypothetical protein PTKIN_Ptkin02bG0154500 [Pterospermum kingtungense]